MIYYKFQLLFLWALILNLYRTKCTFRAKIFDWIKNHTHHRINQPCQQVGYSYIFVAKHYYLTIRTIVIYGAVLSRHILTLDPTSKPIILWYWEDADAYSFTQSLLDQIYYFPSCLTVVVYFIPFCIVISGPINPYIIDIFLAPSMHWYVSTVFFQKIQCLIAPLSGGSAQNLIIIELETLLNIKTMWVCMNIRSYKYLYIYNDVKPSKGVVNKNKGDIRI